MRAESIFKKKYPIKGFVYWKAEFGRDGRGRETGQLLVHIREDGRIRGRCGECDRPGPCHGHQPARKFDMIPIWGMPVWFLYARRRIECPDCGVKAERLDWLASEKGKTFLTTAFACFLGMWARMLPWSQVSQVFGASWHTVRMSVEYLVDYGRKRQDLRGIKAIGVDEIAVSKGKGKGVFLTVVYQLDAGFRRLPWIGRERTEETLGAFFKWFGDLRSGKPLFVCSDMWKPYLKVIAERAVNARNILDRFHIMKNLNEAKDQIRRDETRRLESEGKRPDLKKSRWCFLKRRENLTGDQATRLSELLSMNLRTVRAYLLVEEFQRFWKYVSATWAGRFLENWRRLVMRSRLEPLKRKAITLRGHKDLILNWFAARGEYNGGMVEGLNNKAKTRIKIGYGYRTKETLELALSAC